MCRFPAQYLASSILSTGGRIFALGEEKDTASRPASLSNAVLNYTFEYPVQALAWHPGGKSLVASLGLDVFLAKLTMDGRLAWLVKKSVGHNQRGLFLSDAGDVVFTSNFTAASGAGPGPAIALVAEESGRVLRELPGLAQSAGSQSPQAFTMNRARSRMWVVNSGVPSQYLLRYDQPDWRLTSSREPVRGIDSGYMDLAPGPDETTLIAHTASGYLDQLDAETGALVRRSLMADVGLGPVYAIPGSSDAIVTLSGINAGAASPSAGPGKPEGTYSEAASSVWRVNLNTGKIIEKYDMIWPVASFSACHAGTAALATRLFGRGTKIYIFDINSRSILSQTALPWVASVRVSVSPDGTQVAVARDAHLSVHRLKSA